MPLRTAPPPGSPAQQDEGMFDLIRAVAERHADLAELTRMAHRSDPTLLVRLEVLGISSRIRREQLQDALRKLPPPGDLAVMAAGEDGPHVAPRTRQQLSEVAAVTSRAADSCDKPEAIAVEEELAPPPPGGWTGQDLWDSAAGGQERLLLRILTRGGVDLEWRDREEKTALHAAADRGQPECIAQLLKAGAVVEAQDKYGGTPLLAAVYWGHERCVRLLLEAAADPEAVASNGKSLEELAVSSDRGAILQLIRGAVRMKKAGGWRRPVGRHSGGAGAAG